MLTSMTQYVEETPPEWEMAPPVDVYDGGTLPASTSPIAQPSPSCKEEEEEEPPA